MTSPPSGAFAAETYSVSELCEEVRDLLAQAYASVWVAGEVGRLRTSRRGHLYFELVEKGARDEIVGKLEAVCWSREFQRVRRALAAGGQELAEGQEIRCRASLDFYPPFGRLQLVVREVDPVFTLGQLARRRRETLERLAAGGLLEENRRRPLPPLALRVALVTSEGSAAYHDFVSTLTESPYSFQLSVIHASVQGREAERELVAALRAAERTGADCVALIRGGGARTDLAVFDSWPVAEAVARSPLPVLTGLGHEIDQSIADQVAHTALKTPTKVAEFLVQRAREVDLALAAMRGELARLGAEAVRRAHSDLERAERTVRLALFRLQSAGDRVLALGRLLGRSAERGLGAQRQRARDRGERLARLAPRSLAPHRRRPARLAERLAKAARARLREAQALVEGRERLCRQLGIERTLARGFTMTRSAEGAILTSATRVAAGDTIVTQWADGERTSQVEEA